MLTIFPSHSELEIGDTVRILKQGTSDEFVEGIIEKKISSTENTRGTFVQLKNDTKGRVHELISHNLATVYDVQPEDGRLEYKERFVLSLDEIKYDPKAWKVPFSVYKTIAAFANSEGGKLVIGIHDNGEFLGLQRDYDALKELKEAGRFTFSPDRDGFELKIKMNLKEYFLDREKYVLDLITDIKFKSDAGKEVCEIYVNPTYDVPVIIFEKNSNINKKPIQYKIKNKIIDNALEKQKLSHDPKEKSYSLSLEEKKEHDEFQKCPACFSQSKVIEQIKHDPLELFKEVDHTILFEDLGKILVSNENIPLFFVRKHNSSENYDSKEFIEYWVRRMKQDSYYNK